MKKSVVALLACVATACVAMLAGAQQEDQEPLDLEALLEQFGWDFEQGQITTQKVADDLHVLFGVGGNIAASIGADGVLIVDDMFPEMIPKVEAAIRALGGGSVDYVINTHWHFDHAEGNLALGPGWHRDRCPPKLGGDDGQDQHSQSGHHQIPPGGIPG